MTARRSHTSRCRQGFAPVSIAHRGMRVTWAVQDIEQAHLAASIDCFDIEELMIASIRSPGSSGHVDAHTHGGVDFCCLGFQMQGTQLLRNHRGQSTVAPGDVVVWSSRMTGEFEFPGTNHEVLLFVPTLQLERTWGRLALDDTPKVLSSTLVMVAMAHAGVRALLQQRCELGLEHQSEAVKAVLDLASKADMPLRPTLRSKSDLFTEILQHIERELGNPDITPQSIAGRFGCSVRTLHALFATRGETVSGMIRKRRLERCRIELGCASMPDRIGDLAVQWGFSDAAHFSRLFKASYGVSPRAYKNRPDSA